MVKKKVKKATMFIGLFESVSEDKVIDLSIYTLSDLGNSSSLIG